MMSSLKHRSTINAKIGGHTAAATLGPIPPMRWSRLKLVTKNRLSLKKVADMRTSAPPTGSVAQTYVDRPQRPAATHSIRKAQRARPQARRIKRTGENITPITQITKTARLSLSK